VAVLFKVQVCGRLPAGIAGLNPAGGMDVCLLCVLYNKNKRQSQYNQDKEVRIKNGERQNPGGDKVFHTRPDRPWGPNSLLYYA
jgi:hypothetical protein